MLGASNLNKNFIIGCLKNDDVSVRGVASRDITWLIRAHVKDCRVGDVRITHDECVPYAMVDVMS